MTKLEKAIKKLLNKNDPTDLNTVFAELYAIAMSDAEETEEKVLDRDKNVFVVPPQKIHAHLEQILYDQLKSENLDLLVHNPDLFPKLEDAIANTWKPTDQRVSQAKPVLNKIISHIHKEQSSQKGYFPEEKKKWRREFLEQLDLFLNDDQKQVKAFNDRESLNKKGIKYNSFTLDELRIALNEIDSPNLKSPTYTLFDEERAKGYLKTVGFSDKEIDILKKSDSIKLEAIIFSVYSLFNYGDTSTGKKGPIFEAYCNLYDKPELANKAAEILAEQQNFQQQFLQFAKPKIQLYIQYYQARDALQNTLKQAGINEDLKGYGHRILEEVEKATHPKPSIPLYKLTNSLKAANKAIKDPSIENANACAKQGLKIAKRSKTKIIGGLLLGLAGTIIVLASVAVAAVSFGALSPVSAFGITLGASLIVGGIAVATGAIGVAAVFGGGISLFSGVKKHPVRKELDILSKEIKKKVNQ